MTQNEHLIFALPNWGSFDHEKKRAVVDLETLSIEDDAVIVGIGVVAMTENMPDSDFGLFFTPVDPISCEAIGLARDEETPRWWSEQSAQVRAAVFVENPPSIAEALTQFADWYTRSGCQTVWGNDSIFDVGLLQKAFKLARKAGHDVTLPWHFRAPRCYRTMREELPNCMNGLQNSMPHHPLHDALFEAKVLQRLLQRLPKE